MDKSEDAIAPSAVTTEQVEAGREMREMQSYVVQTRAAALKALRDGELALVDPNAIREMLVQYQTMAQNFHDRYPSDDTFRHCLEQAEVFLGEDAF
jgi:hypothetical protein